MSDVANILKQVEMAAGTNAKLAILLAHKENATLRKALVYGLDPYRKFGVVKVPKIESRPWNANGETSTWESFFDVLDSCAARSLTGNAAVAAVQACLRQADEATEEWMRKILQGRFAIGANAKTVEKVFGDLYPKFSVQLAGKWHAKTSAKMPAYLRAEPKLDGIRFIGRVQDGVCSVFSRAGKVITNFDKTIGLELARLPDGVYDGEVMDEDFIALMRQVHRKSANVSKSYLMLFDVVPLNEWDARRGVTPFHQRRQNLVDALGDLEQWEYLRLIEWAELKNSNDAVKTYHDECFSQGFEGCMVKDPYAPYCFGRGDAVLKVKMTEEADCKVIGFKEGTGKYRGMLGALIVDFEGVRVDVGTGLKDWQRKEFWDNQEKYLGQIAEVRYQEVTPEKSLRFPRFRFWRLDKE